MLIVEISFVITTVLALEFNVAVATWAQNHIAFMFVLMFLKSDVILRKVLPIEDDETECVVKSVAIVVIDAIRSGAVVYGMVELLDYIIAGGLQNYIVGCAVVGIAASLLFFGESSVYAVYTILKRTYNPLAALHFGAIVEIFGILTAFAACLWFFMFG